jgi:hypothetical protein
MLGLWANMLETWGCTPEKSANTAETSDCTLGCRQLRNFHSQIQNHNYRCLENKPVRNLPHQLLEKKRLRHPQKETLLRHPPPLG